MTMTQQYLAGELLLLLAEVQGLATSHGVASAAAVLRREAESLPPAALGPVAARGLRLIDESCWCSLAAGDVAIFQQQAEIEARLFEFAACARLIDDE